MFRYADPQLCPGCRSTIEYGATQCPRCGLPLDGPLASKLFGTLTQADSLLAAMQVAVVSTSPTSPTVEWRPSPVSTSSTLETPRGLSSASIPKILLGLGATCLLVAALVFMAVAWAELGVGGRTGVLVFLTLAASAAATWTARKDLRAGAESFGAVALGLLALDLGGADNAGWLGDPSRSTFLIVLGTVVGGAGLIAAVAAQRTPVGSLLCGEIVGAIGGLVAGVGLFDADGFDDEPGLILISLLTAGLAFGSRLLALRVAAAALAGISVAWWAILVGFGIVRLEGMSIASVWGEFNVWPLLVATAMIAALALVRELPVAGRVTGAGAGALLGTLAVTVVSFDESATTVALMELAVVAFFALVSLVVANPWRAITVAPAGIAGLHLAVTALRLAGRSAESLIGNQPWELGLTDTLPFEDMPWSWPLLLPAGAIAALVSLWVGARCVAEVPRERVAPVVTAVALFTAVLVPPLYGVPLWVGLMVLVAGAGLLAAIALRMSWLEAWVAAGLLAVLALMTSSANEWSTLVVLILLAAASGVLAYAGRDALRAASAMLFGITSAGAIWTALDLAAVDLDWRALPVVVLLGLFALHRPLVEREATAIVVGSIAVAGSVLSDAGVDQSWLAIYLTLGGALLSISALIHPTRRELGWAAGASFTAAQWIRLEQLGVETVEAYTLPLALVLLAVGVIWMLRTESSSHRALSAGLSLALVPTLLQVLVDPVSGRALVLGAACLSLIGVGVTRRWAAPLVAGASVGLLVVLREAAYAQVVPQWVVIGLVGVALSVVGITWEQRLVELRLAAGYVKRLR